MIVNIGTRIAPVNIAFSSSRNAALIERKILQYTTSSINYHHCTLSETKNPNFYKIRRPCLCPNTLRAPETTLHWLLFHVYTAQQGNLTRFTAAIFQELEHLINVTRQSIHQQCFKIGNSSAMQWDKMWLSNVTGLGTAHECDKTWCTSTMC